MDKQTKVLYREVQRPRQIWLWALILFTTFMMWYWFIQQIIFGVPFGDNPALDPVTIIFFAIFGIVFPIVMLGMLKLIIEVRDDGLYIRLFPFHIKYKQFPFKDIREYRSLTYRPLKRFGGWGIRLNLQGETAYNLNGKEGIKLTLKYDTVVIGTRNPNELKTAIDSVQKSQ